MILLIIVVKWGRFYPLGPSLGGGWGRGVEFPRSTSYEKHTYQFSDFYLQDCDFTYNCSQMGVILPPGTLPWGWGFGGGELNFLDLLHMINTHTNFQLPTSKTVILLIIVVKWGRFYPLGPSLGGGLGAGS